MQHSMHSDTFRYMSSLKAVVKIWTVYNKPLKFAVLITYSEVKTNFLEKPVYKKAKTFHCCE